MADFRPDIDPINVRPSMGTYNNPQTFRFWCQKVLPLVYDNSLSYYELLCKVVDYLNKTMEDVNTAVEDVTNLNNAFGSLENHVNASEAALLQAYTDLQNYVNNYFDSLDFQQAINDKLDEMASDGTLDALLLPYFNTYVETTDAQIQEITTNMEEFVLNYVAEARGQIRDATAEMQDTLNDAIDAQDERLDSQDNIIETVQNQFDQLIALQTAGTMQGAKITTFRAVNPLEYTTTSSDVLPYQSFSFVNHAGNQNTSPSMSVLDGLVNPTLVSAGAYVLDNQSDPVTGKCIYLNLSDTTRFYPTGGFLGSAPDKRAVRFSVNYDAVDIYTTLTGKWLVFEFSVLSDVPTDLSEITDARVGADGVTYTTLGDAIRTQITNVDNEVSDNYDMLHNLINAGFYTNLSISWEQGALTAQGEELDLDTRIRTDFIDVSFYSIFIATKLNSYETYTLLYDKNKNVLGHIGWSATTPQTIKLDSAYYIRLVLRKPVNTDTILPTDGTNCSIKVWWRTTPITFQAIENTGFANLYESIFLHNKLTYIRTSASSLNADLPEDYQNPSNLFVLTFAATPNNATTIVYEQFIFNNAVKKIYFRAFSINGGYSSLRAWTPLINYTYLFNKTGIVLGDSISYGLYSYWDGNDRKNSDGLSPDYAPKRISDYFAELCGMSITNVAKRGSGYVADTRRLGNALEVATNTDFSGYNLALLCFGINDWIRNMPLGSLEADAEGTVVGNLSRVLKKIYSDNPLCKVVIYTPYNAWGQVAVNQDVNDLYGDETTNYALGTANTQGYTLQQLIDTIKNVADHYGVTCTGLGDSNVVNRINIKDIMIDGLHPSLDSLPLLAAEMFAQKDFG